MGLTSDKLNPHSYHFFRIEQDDLLLLYEVSCRLFPLFTRSLVHT